METCGGVLTVKPTDEILARCHSNETSSAAVLHGTNISIFDKMKFGIFLGFNRL